jgi:hypothetical protein
MLCALDVLRRFIESGPATYFPYVLSRFDETRQVGTRRKPPSTLDMRSAYTRKPTAVSVRYGVGKAKCDVHTHTRVQEILDLMTQAQPDIAALSDFALFCCSPHRDRVSYC